MKNGRDLLKTIQLLEVHPNLEQTFHSLSAILGNIITAKRMEIELTQIELCSIANVDLNTLASAEGGSCILPIATYAKLFKALELAPHDIGKAIVQLTEQAASPNCEDRT